MASACCVCSALDTHTHTHTHIYPHIGSLTLFEIGNHLSHGMSLGKGTLLIYDLDHEQIETTEHFLNYIDALRQSLPGRRIAHLQQVHRKQVMYTGGKQEGKRGVKDG